MYLIHYCNEPVLRGSALEECGVTPVNTFFNTLGTKLMHRCEEHTPMNKRKNETRDNTAG